MNLLIQLRFTLFAVVMLFSTGLFAEGNAPVKKDAQTIKGDKAYAKLKFARAIAHYTNALSTSHDSIYLQQRIAFSYKALNDQVNAEKAYAQLANNASAGSINKYYYAELLRIDKSYTSARKYYEDYSKASSNGQNINAAIEQMDRIAVLTVPNPAYKVSSVNFNSAKSDFAPVYYQDGKLIFSSNRSNKKALYDKWSMGRYIKLYITGLDSTAKIEKIAINGKAKSFVNSTAFLPSGTQLIFSKGSFKKSNTVLKDGRRLPVLNLYSAVITGSMATNIEALSLNGDFSNAHPSVTKDGKTLYFASDRLGGQGGTDQPVHHTSYFIGPLRIIA